MVGRNKKENNEFQVEIPNLFDPHSLVLRSITVTFYTHPVTDRLSFCRDRNKFCFFCRFFSPLNCTFLFLDISTIGKLSILFKQKRIVLDRSLSFVVNFHEPNIPIMNHINKTFLFLRGTIQHTIRSNGHSAIVELVDS